MKSVCETRDERIRRQSEDLDFTLEHSEIDGGAGEDSLLALDLGRERAGSVGG